MSEMTATGQTVKTVNMDQECRCLFCGQTFLIKDIVFAENEKSGSSSSLVDTTFEKAMDEYKLIDGDVAVEAPFRRFYRWDENDIDSYEAGPGGTFLPLSVVGHIAKDHVKGTKSKSILASVDEETDVNEKEQEQDITQKTTVRLCPKCHMTLPEGFSTEKVRRIGLLGGPRCGKTTYMVVACMYMEKYLGLLSGGLDLGAVSFLPECDQYLKKLYNSQRRAAGAAATDVDSKAIKDKPVFPIIAHIVPSNIDYKPFFVIIQDIPGEYMRPENKNKLINSAIPLSTDLISLVDINSLTWTQMMSTTEFGAYCKLGPGELFKNFSTLGNELKKNKKLQTIQLCLTKIDFWQAANPEIKNSTILFRPGDEEHRNSISDQRLETIDIQVKHRLKMIGGKDQSGMMTVMLRSLNFSPDMEIKTAHSAIASRMVPGNEEVFRANGIDYSTSLNVLEPLLNIFSWENLLPHDSEPRNLVSEDSENEEETIDQKPRGFLYRLFHRY